MVRMTLMNLLKNALEASQDNSKISIRFQLQAKSSVCEINNQGLVPEPVKERFFEKYSTHGKAEGNGLGTYTAKLLTEAQSGNIWFESEEDTGTTVFVEYRRVN